MKGVELTINTIVIIVLCFLVLVAVIALFLGVWKPGETGMTLENAKNNACQIYVSTGCNDYPEITLISNFDANNNNELDSGSTFAGWDNPDHVGDKDNLASLCWFRYNIRSLNSCKQLCGCS